MRVQSAFGAAAAAVIAGVSVAAWLLTATPSARTAPTGDAPVQGYELNDSHFHLTNYVQEGTNIRDFLKIMGNRVGRVALFGIPLQQM